MRRPIHRLLLYLLSRYLLLVVGVFYLLVLITR